MRLDALMLFKAFGCFLCMVREEFDGTIKYFHIKILVRRIGKSFGKTSGNSSLTSVLRFLKSGSRRSSSRPSRISASFPRLYPTYTARRSAIRSEDRAFDHGSWTPFLAWETLLIGKWRNAELADAIAYAHYISQTTLS